MMCVCVRVCVRECVRVRVCVCVSCTQPAAGSFYHPSCSPPPVPLPTPPAVCNLYENYYPRRMMCFGCRSAERLSDGAMATLSLNILLYRLHVGTPYLYSIIIVIVRL